MASPPSVNIDDLAGKFVSNSILSDDPEPALILQGVPWMARKAIRYKTITLATKKSCNDAGIPVLDTDAYLIAGLKGISERRVLDWSDMRETEGMFGHVVDQIQCYQELEMAGDGGEQDLNFLNGKILQDGTPSSWLEDSSKQHIQGFSRSTDKGWTMEQTWGFEEIKGLRYHTRRCVVRKGDEVQRIRFVYDFAPL